MLTLDNYVHFGQLHSLLTKTFTLNKTTTFTFDNYVHFGQLCLHWTTKFTLDKYVDYE